MNSINRVKNLMEPSPCCEENLFIEVDWHKLSCTCANLDQCTTFSFFLTWRFLESQIAVSFLLKSLFALRELWVTTFKETQVLTSAGEQRGRCAGAWKESNGRMAAICWTVTFRSLLAPQVHGKQNCVGDNNSLKHTMRACSSSTWCSS